MKTVDVVLENIKNLRILNGYKTSDVAKGIGYKTSKGYYDLETGKTDIKLEHLEKLSKFYKVPLEIFFTKNSTVLVHDKRQYSVS